MDMAADECLALIGANEHMDMAAEYPGPIAHKVPLLSRWPFLFMNLAF